MARDIRLAAGRVDEWLLASNGSTEAENAAITKKSRTVSSNRLALELGRQGKIGAIDKQVLSIRVLRPAECTINSVINRKYINFVEPLMFLYFIILLSDERK